MQRNTSFGIIVLFLFSSLQAAPAPKPAVNLLINGSFEDGIEPADFKALEEGSKDIKGWVVTRGQIDYIGKHWNSADGNRSIDLHGSPGIGGVKQTFKTAKNKKHLVTLSICLNPNSNTDSKEVWLAAAGDKKNFKCEGRGAKTTELKWEVKTWEFVTNEDETTLEIYSEDKADPFSGPAIDRVSVVEVK